MFILDIVMLLFLVLGPIYFGCKDASSKRTMGEKITAFIEGVFSTVISIGICTIALVFFISLLNTFWSNIFG